LLFIKRWGQLIDVPAAVRYLSAPGLLRDAITDVLRSAFACAEITVEAALPPNQGWPALRKGDLLIVDDSVCTPVELSARLGRALPAAPLIYMMTHADFAIARAALAHGVAATVLKTEPIGTFRHVLRFVHEGNRYLSPEFVMHARGRSHPWPEWAIENVPAFVHVVQGDRIAYVNDATLARLGLTRDQVIGRHYWPFVAEDQQADLRAFVDAWFAGESPSDRIKVQVTAIPESDLWMDSTLRLGEFCGESAMAVVSTDITAAMLRAEAFGCTLSQCKLGPKEPTARGMCRRCIYGLPQEAAPEPFALAALAPPGERVATESLSRRQRAVLRLVAAGWTNRQIAAELAIKETTVKAYVHQIMRALGVRNRTSAALAYRAAGEPAAELPK